MRKTLMLSLLVPAVLLVLSSAAAADPAAGGKGTVKGKVLNADGKPAAGIPVRLMHRAAGKKAAAAANDSPAEPRKRGKGQPGPAARAQAAAETTADASGEFAFADVPVGNYVAVARLKGVGAARQQVHVTADKPANVTLTLKAPAPRKKPAPGGEKAGKRQARAARKFGVS
jgi:hypothetical protein